IARKTHGITSPGRLRTKPCVAASRSTKPVRVFASNRIPFVHAARAILTLHLNQTEFCRTLGQPERCVKARPLARNHPRLHVSQSGLSNQQLHKYYKALLSLMLRSIQAAMGGKSRNIPPLTKGTGPWTAMGNATRHLLSR